MKLAHRIIISVFCKPEEEEGRIKASLLSLVPFKLEDEKIELKETKAKGFGERVIKIFEIDLEKEKHTNLFLSYLKDRLNEEQKKMLVKQINSRLDDELHFFIRLDKSGLLNKEYAITDSGNCFHIKISVAAFPAKKENGIKIIKGIFKEQ